MLALRSVCFGILQNRGIQNLDFLSPRNPTLETLGLLCMAGSLPRALHGPSAALWAHMAMAATADRRQARHQMRRRILRTTFAACRTAKINTREDLNLRFGSIARPHRPPWFRVDIYFRRTRCQDLLLVFASVCLFTKIIYKMSGFWVCLFFRHAGCQIFGSVYFCDTQDDAVLGSLLFSDTYEVALMGPVFARRH